MVIDKKFNLEEFVYLCLNNQHSLQDIEKFLKQNIKNYKEVKTQFEFLKEILIKEGKVNGNENNI